MFRWTSTGSVEQGETRDKDTASQRKEPLLIINVYQHKNSLRQLLFLVMGLFITGTASGSAYTANEASL
jgi:hypothetical protein